MPALDLAHDLIEAALAAGIRELVLCPGSRSAPLAYAAYAAEIAGRARLHVRVDERSAAFLALGLAKTSRNPAAIITTSGTAVANLHPAVLEAHHAKAPLLVLSADRPAALRGSGANQTTIQPGIFGGAVRFEADLDDTADDPTAVMTAAVRAALGTPDDAERRDPGPVHLNICLAEPLVPDAWPIPGMPTGPPEPGRPSTDAAEFAADQPSSDAGRSAALVPSESLPSASMSSAPVPPAPSPITLAAGERTLVLLGDLVDARTRPRVIAWAARHGYPVIAEPLGRHPDSTVVLPHGPLLLTDAAFVDAHCPDAILAVGRLTLSRPVSALLRRPGIMVTALTDTADCPDPLTVVAERHDLESVLAADEPHTAVPAEVRAEIGGSAWAQAWWAAGQAVAAAVAADPPAWPTGLAVARALVDALPPDAILFTGPSNPVRDIDFGVARVPPSATIVASRGLAGIDGCVSTALGIALAEPGRAAYVLLGDLTFLHDSGALLIGPGEPRPDLTIVVVNDSGGGIFGLLEPGMPQLAAPFERLFGTPTSTDLGALVRAHGIAHQVLTEPSELTAAVCRAPQGLRVLEVQVPRTGHREAHARLRATAAAAVRA